MRRSLPAREDVALRSAEILDSITDAVIVLDHAGTVIYINPAAEQLAQRPRAEILGRPTWEAFAEAFTPDLFRQYLVTVQQRMPVALDVYFPPRGMWFEVHVSPWSGGLTLLCSDISDRKRAEQERSEALQREQQARRESEQISQRIVGILESISDAFFALDSQGRFTYVNKKAADLWGMDREQLIGRSLWDVFPEFIGSEMQHAYEEVVARRESFAIEFYYPPTGAWLDIRAYPADDGLSVYFVDFTARKKAEAEREALLAEVQQRAAEMDNIMASMAAGVMIFDPAGRVTRMNDAAANILRLSPKERSLPPEQIWAMLRAETPEGAPLPYEQAPSSRALRGEEVLNVTVVMHPRGMTLWKLCSASPTRMPDGKLLGVVTTFFDITALHEAQEQLEDVLRAVSHDLRNPLTSVLGPAQLLERRLAKAGMPRERESAGVILAAAQRMDTMIQDLVDAARSMTGQIKLERRPVDMRSFALELKERLATSLETARIDVQVPPGLPPVWVDPGRLERILANLWSNALKYSTPGTPVSVNAYRRDGEIVTAITDRGPGIPPEDLPRLFQRYTRAGAAREAREGLGLGLYITRRLVEAHNGRIWAESTVGVGSTFSFSLPIAQGDSSSTR